MPSDGQQRSDLEQLRETVQTLDTTLKIKAAQFETLTWACGILIAVMGLFGWDSISRIEGHIKAKIDQYSTHAETARIASENIYSNVKLESEKINRIISDFKSRNFNTIEIITRCFSSNPNFSQAIDLKSGVQQHQTDKSVFTTHGTRVSFDRKYDTLPKIYFFVQGTDTLKKIDFQALDHDLSGFTLRLIFRSWDSPQEVDKIEGYGCVNIAVIGN